MLSHHVGPNLIFSLSMCFLHLPRHFYVVSYVPPPTLVFSFSRLPTKSLVDQYRQKQAEDAKKGAGKAKESSTGKKGASKTTPAKKRPKKTSAEPAKALSAADIVSGHETGGDRVAWEADAVIDERLEKGKPQFLVQWAKTNTGVQHEPEWCDEEQLEDAQDLIEAYRASIKDDDAQSGSSAEPEKVDTFLRGYKDALKFTQGEIMRTSLQVALGNGAGRRYCAAGMLDVKGSITGEPVGTGDATFYRMGLYDKETDKFIGPGTVVGDQTHVIIGVQYASSHWQAVTVAKETFLQPPEQATSGQVRFFKHYSFPLAEFSLDEDLVQDPKFWGCEDAWVDRYVTDSRVTVKKPPLTSSQTPRKNTRRGSGNSPYNFRDLEGPSEGALVVSDAESAGSGDEDVETKKKTTRRRGAKKSPKKRTKRERSEEEPATQVTQVTQPERMQPSAPPNQMAKVATAPHEARGNPNVRLAAVMAMQEQKIILLEEQVRKRKEEESLEKIMALFPPE